MPSPFGGDFLFSEGEIVVGGDVIDESSKAFYGNILGYMSFVQDLYLQGPMRLRAHEQFQKGDSTWGLVELFNDFELALLDNAEEFASLIE